jgi:hypothetical protein
MIYKLYKYLFYKSYEISKLRKVNRAIAHDIANTAISAFLYINIVTLVIIILYLLNVDYKVFVKFLYNNVLINLIFGFIILIINYYIFLYHKKYRKIIIEFENETKKQNILGYILLFCYFIISIILFVIILILIS